MVTLLKIFSSLKYILCYKNFFHFLIMYLSHLEYPRHLLQQRNFVEYFLFPI